MSQPLPFSPAHGVLALAGEVGGGQLHLGQCPANSMGLAGRGRADRYPGQELDQGHGLTIQQAVQITLPVMDGTRYRATLGREMIEQREEEGQFLHLDPKLVHGQDEARAGTILAGGFNQPVAVRNPLGNAFDRSQFANVKLRNKLAQNFRAQMGVNRHAGILVSQLPGQLEHNLFLGGDDLFNFN